MPDDTTNHRTIIVDCVSIENIFPDDDPFIRSMDYRPPIGVKAPIGVRLTFTAEGGESASLTCLFSSKMMNTSFVAADDRKEITIG